MHFCSCDLDLDLDPMTLKYELDLKTLNSAYQNEHARSRLSKLEALQTDGTHYDVTSTSGNEFGYLTVSMLTAAVAYPEALTRRRTT